MSGQLDNPSSSVDCYLSDDNNEPGLQQTLIEESRQIRLNHIRLISNHYVIKRKNSIPIFVSSKMIGSLWNT